MLLLEAGPDRRGDIRTMIDRHYGHLARDGREHAIQLLDALNAPVAARWTLVDGAWTPKQDAAASAKNKNSG